MIRNLFIILLLILVGCVGSPEIEKSKADILKNKKTPIVNLESIFNDDILLINDKYELTILLFFDLNCPHCVDAIESLENKLIPKMDTKKFQFIGIGRGHSKSTLIKWAKKNKIVMKLVSDEEKKIYYKFANEGVPYFFLIDKHGIIRVSFVGWSIEINNYLIKYLTPRSRMKVINA